MKNERKMSAMIAHSWPITRSYDEFQGRIAAVFSGVHDFLRCFVTVVDNWINYYTAETKELSKPSKCLHQQKAKTIPSVEKVMATIFSFVKEKALEKGSNFQVHIMHGY